MAPVSHPVARLDSVIDQAVVRPILPTAIAVCGVPRRLQWPESTRGRNRHAVDEGRERGYAWEPDVILLLGKVLK